MILRIQEGDKELKVFELDGGGVPIYYYQGKPFTGIVYQNEKDGSLAWEQEYQEGYQEGWVRTYYTSGKKAQEYKSHNNKEIEGSFKEWDEAGNLIVSF